MKKYFWGITSVVFCSLLLAFNQVPINNSMNQQETIWLPVDIITQKSNNTQIFGKPQKATSKFGDVIQFDGKNDGIFIDTMPLKGLNQFTIEVIFFPETGGNFEQRFFHCGEIKESRVLLETRSTATDWYFDAFIKSGDQSAVLIEPKLTHPLNQWYHLAYVVDNGHLSTYVNGAKELEANIEFTPIISGKTSIGVRLNKVSWFKGKIYKIRISETALIPDNFLKIN